MRLVVRQLDRHRVGVISLDVDERPARVTTIDTDTEVFLDWERAFDDSGQIRRCIICGCDQLYRHKTFPQITPFVILLAFGLAFIGVLGLVTDIAALLGMTAVLMLDIGILFFARVHLYCYRCRSQFSNVEIANYHQRWDRATEARRRRDETPRHPESHRRHRDREDY
jgi:hypothetical protein